MEAIMEAIMVVFMVTDIMEAIPLDSGTTKVSLTGDRKDQALFHPGGIVM
jgi:hypothetical protein